MQFRQKWIVFYVMARRCRALCQRRVDRITKTQKYKRRRNRGQFFDIFLPQFLFLRKNKWSSSTCQISDIIQVSDNHGSDNALKVYFLKIQSPHFRGNFARAFGMMVMMMMMVVVYSSDHFHYLSDISAPYILVGRPTRWSLLFIFGFLFWSSN